jgi:hypothetical protein
MSRKEGVARLETLARAEKTRYAFLWNRHSQAAEHEHGETPRYVK